MATSKTARRSSPSSVMVKNMTPEQKVAASVGSPIHRVLSLNNGLHCRLANPGDGKNRHLATDSDEFYSQVRYLAENGLRERLTSEFTDLAAKFPQSAWPAVLAALTSPGGALVEAPDASDDQAPVST